VRRIAFLSLAIGARSLPRRAVDVTTHCVFARSRGAGERFRVGHPGRLPDLVVVSRVFRRSNEARPAKAVPPVLARARLGRLRAQHAPQATGLIEFAVRARRDCGLGDAGLVRVAVLVVLVGNPVREVPGYRCPDLRLRLRRRRGQQHERDGQKPRNKLQISLHAASPCGCVRVICLL
jgi:hypothetical protein